MSQEISVRVWWVGDGPAPSGLDSILAKDEDGGMCAMFWTMPREGEWIRLLDCGLEVQVVSVLHDPFIHSHGYGPYVGIHIDYADTGDANGEV